MCDLLHCEFDFHLLNTIQNMKWNLNAIIFKAIQHVTSLLILIHVWVCCQVVPSHHQNQYWNVIHSIVQWLGGQLVWGHWPWHEPIVNKIWDIIICNGLATTCGWQQYHWIMINFIQILSSYLSVCAHSGLITLFGNVILNMKLFCRLTH